MSCTDNPNSPGNDGWTPIHSACMDGHKNIVKLLMSHTNNPNTPDNAGNTPKNIALQNNHHEIAALFDNIFVKFMNKFKRLF